MSIFSACIICNEVAQTVCSCSNTPYFYCNYHAIEHTNSQGEHPSWPALDSLSSEEISCIHKAFETYRDSYIREALSAKNSIIDCYLREIRKTEEKCSSLIERIFKEPIKRETEEVTFRGALPLFSQSAYIKYLLSLKQGQNLSEEKLLEYLRSVLPSPKSCLADFSSALSPSTMISHRVSPVQSSSTPWQFSRNLRSPPLAQASVATETEWMPLKRKNKAHEDQICSIAISDCEKYLASGSRDEVIKIWNLNTLKLLQILRGHTNTVRSVVFLGTMIVSGSADKTVKIWEEGNCLATLPLHSSIVTSVCVSSHKRLIVSGSCDKTIVIYSLELSKTVHILIGHSHYVESVALSSNNREIVSASLDKSIKMWSTDTGELLKTLNGHSDSVYSVALHEEFIVSCSKDKTVKIWNRRTGEALFTLQGHSSGVMSADVKGNLIVSLGVDDKIIAWSARTRTVIQNLQGHGNYDSGYLMSVKCSEEGKFIASGGRDRTLRVWRKIN